MPSQVKTSDVNSLGTHRDAWEQCYSWVYVRARLKRVTKLPGSTARQHEIPNAP